MMQNAAIVITTSAGAMTAALKTQAGLDPSPGDPCTFTFPDANGGSTVATVTAPLSLAVPAGAALNFTSNVPGRLWWLAMLTGSGVVLGVVKPTTTQKGGIDEENPQSSLTINSSSNAAQTIYSAISQTNVPVQAIAYSTWEAGVLAAGTWTMPTTTRLRVLGTVMPGQPIGNPVDLSFPVGTYSVSYGTAWTNTLSTISMKLRSAANLVEIGYSGEILLATGNTPVEGGILRGGTLIDGAMSAYSDQAADTNGIGTPIADYALDFPQASTATWTVGLRTKTTQVSTYGGVEADASCKMYGQEYQA